MTACPSITAFAGALAATEPGNLFVAATQEQQ
jgi:hypothetical protein